MLTGKQTAFKDYIISGESPSQAYKLAGYSSNMLPETLSSNAYKLLHENNEIAMMVADARKAVVSELVEKGKYTAESLAEEAMKNLGLARGLSQIAAANKAIELCAKLTGNLEGPPAHTEVRITKVTVVLPPTEGETRIVDVETYEVYSETEKDIEGPQ